jgi:hypothetical protein
MGSQQRAYDKDAPRRDGDVGVSRVQLAVRMDTPACTRANLMQTESCGGSKHKTPRDRPWRTHAQRLTAAPAAAPLTTPGGPAAANYDA